MVPENDIDITQRLLRLLLRPAARYCLRRAVSFQEAVDAFKAELVNQAVNEIEMHSERVNVSRISVMTGMQRRDVAKLLGESPSAPNKSFSQRVLGQWEQDPRFQSKSGVPRVLTYGGDESEFTQLVKVVSKDLNPAAMLLELERIGAVSRTPRGLKLEQAVRSYSEESNQVYDLLSRDIETLLRSAEDNIEKNANPKNLHLRTEFDNIFVEELPRIRQWLLEQGAEFHRRTREYLSRFDQDINPLPEKCGGGLVVLKDFSWTFEPSAQKRKSESDLKGTS